MNWLCVLSRVELQQLTARSELSRACFSARSFLPLTCLSRYDARLGKHDDLSFITELLVYVIS